MALAATHRFAPGCRMQFHIIGPHEHRAVVGPTTFLCIRRDVVTEDKRVIAWLACRNNTVLKDDCRTLNEAKNLCRRTLAEESVIRG
jgi:hypothetical protein